MIEPTVSMSDAEISRHHLESRNQPIVKFKIISQSKKVGRVFISRVSCREGEGGQGLMVCEDPFN